MVMIIKAGLDWDLISKAEIKDIIVGPKYKLVAGGLERTQKTHIIHILLKNSPYSKKKSYVTQPDDYFSVIIVEALEHFVKVQVETDTTGSLEFKIRTEVVSEGGEGSEGEKWMQGGWEIELEFNIDIDTNNVSEQQIERYIADIMEMHYSKLLIVEGAKFDSFPVLHPQY